MISLEDIVCIENAATSLAGGLSVVGTAAVQTKGRIQFAHNLAAERTSVSIASSGPVTVLGNVTIAASAPPAVGKRPVGGVYFFLSHCFWSRLPHSTVLFLP
jgi:hypothetical protein